MPAFFSARTFANVAVCAVKEMSALAALNGWDVRSRRSGVRVCSAEQQDFQNASDSSIGVGSDPMRPITAHPARSVGATPGEARAGLAPWLPGTGCSFCVLDIDRVALRGQALVSRGVGA